MREHEFRGKRIDNGEWVYGSLIESDDAVYIFDRKKNFTPITEIPEYHSQGMGCGLEDRCIHDRYEAMAHGWNEAVDRFVENMPDFYEVMPDTAGQWTGTHLRTENKRRVYEGDRLEIRYHNGEKTLIEVRYSEYSTGFSGIRVSGSNDNILGCQSYSLNFSGSAVEGVYYIGTIHDK